MERTIKRGDIYYAELNPVIGSEQGGKRPVLILFLTILETSTALRLLSLLSQAEYTQKQNYLRIP